MKLIFKRKINSLIIVLSIIFLFLFFITLFSDVLILAKHNPNQKQIACIAIRDNVVAFQKFGTRLFTLPYLDKYYNKTYYFTQNGFSDKHNEFIQSLNELLSDYSTVDIYLLAHGNFYYEWISEIEPEKRKRIRLVYNTGCSNSEQSDIWLQLGVKSYVAHPGSQSISPAFYFFFLRRWTAGYKLNDAVKESNEKMIIRIKGIQSASFGLIHIEKEMLNGSIAEIFGEKKINISTLNYE